MHPNLKTNDGAFIPDDIIQDVIEEFGQESRHDTDKIEEDSDVEDIEVIMDEHAEVEIEEGEGDMEE